MQPLKNWELKSTNGDQRNAPAYRADASGICRTAEHSSQDVAELGNRAQNVSAVYKKSDRLLSDT